VYIAAIHLNERPGDITLNNESPRDVRHEHMWSEVKVLQKKGVKVMGMLGGAAKGSYDNLGRDVSNSMHAMSPLLPPHRQVMVCVC
jgi:hypothetical protein